jgi:hypothetical protein
MSKTYLLKNIRANQIMNIWKHNALPDPHRSLILTLKLPSTVLLPRLDEISEPREFALE